MIKKIIALSLAGALALPFVSGGNAQAATKPESVSIAYTKLIGSQNLKDSQVPDLEKILQRLGISLSLSQIQEMVPQTVSVPTNSKPAGQKPAPKPVQQGKPKQPAKPAKQAPAKTTGSATKQPTSSQLSAFEKKVVDLTNQERTKAGLSPLKADNAALSKMARDKSADMRDKNYFDHQSPTYGSPFDMMKKYGITYRAAGENIAAGQKTPEEVVNGWMNSPGHRANILNGNYTTIGVGYVSGGSYGSYWTQEFIGK
jgi:uncharacterized protein, YkwD family